MPSKLFLFTLVLCLFTKAHGQNLYSYEDLLALESQGAYQEFFEHYKDIRPTQRGADWQKLVKTMGEAYATELSERVSIDRLELKAINELNQISEVSQNEIFQLRRKSVLSRYFNKCFTTHSFSTCHENLQKSIDLKTDGKEILYELGEVLRKQLKTSGENLSARGHIELWPYYAKALNDPMAEFYCTEELQKGLIWNKLTQKAQNTSVNEDFQLNEILHESCWKKVRLVVQKKFLDGPRPVQQEAYKILILAKDMTELEKSTNALIYILSTTLTGDLLNLAWKEVGKLEKNYALRDKVIENMKLLDPLPGLIFNSHENRRITLVIKYVFKNVPEYIDLYGQTCLKYMASEVIYPNGNPTPYCHELFELAKKENLLPAPVQKRYAKLLNFNFDEVLSE